MKTCSEHGCLNPIFGGTKCKYHQFKRHMQGGDLFKRKPKSSIPKESKKRKEERKRYTEVCDLLTEEIRAKNNGKVFCFFSGQEITAKRPHYHHLKSRTGDYYTDKEWLVPALDEFHVDGYHSKSVEYLLQQKWYTDIFLVNLRNKSEELYQKELRKREKSEPINPRKGYTLFDDEDF